jgi:hypothetical protein
MTKPTPPPPPPLSQKGVKVFTYPKTIFIWPTLIVAIVCSIVMAVTGDHTDNPVTATRAEFKAKAEAGTPLDPANQQAELTKLKHDRFLSPANMCGLVFLVVFFTNLVIITIDFPRFTIIAIILSVIAGVFFLMWLNVYFELLPPLVRLVEQSYTVANSAFYGTVAIIILLLFAVIWVTRYLDYWEIMPNEILHHHGPLSDLERFPTMNMKFDKEIPDILEYLLLRSGRLVLHFAGEKRSVTLDNVLWIDRIEDELKKLLSRMEVRITTDQEAASL